MSSELKFFDTHAHYNLRDFNEDLPEVTKRIRAAGVLRDAVIGIDLPSSERAVELAKEDSARLAVVGIHPTHVAKASKWDLLKIRNLAGLDVWIKENRVKGIPGQAAAVGEIGLDYHAGSQRVPDGGKILEKDVGNNFPALLSIRALPVFPIDFVSLFWGASRCKFPRYLLASLLGILPRVVLFTILGDGIYDYIPIHLLVKIIICAIPARSILPVRTRIRGWGLRTSSP